MDSVSQFALGAAVGVATLGRRMPAWRAALWGGLCGTLPDLDVIADHGDPVRNMTMHRTETHALFYQTLATPVIAGLIGWRERAAGFGRLCLMVWLALITHPLLDTMTVYGTQLGLPFTDHPYQIGSVFIIDPLYTLPLLIGTGIALVGGAGQARRARWNTVGLVVSTAYLAWSVAAQQQVRQVALQSLDAAGIAHRQVLVTAAPLTTLLWRVVAMTPDGYVEGYRALLDDARPMTFTHYPSNAALARRHADNWSVARITWFSQGFVDVDPIAGGLRMRDLRMGTEPHYTFVFDIPMADRADATDPPAIRPAASAAPPLPALAQRPQQAGSRPDLATALSWLGRRILGERVPPPTGPT